MERGEGERERGEGGGGRWRGGGRGGDGEEGVVYVISCAINLQNWFILMSS